MNVGALTWIEDASIDEWWASVPEHIRRRVEETASVARSSATNDGWWLPIVAHLLEAHALALPLDVDRERRAARELAQVCVDVTQKELARVRAAASESAAARWERRARAAARLVTQTSRKTVSVDALWDALELTDDFGRAQFIEIDQPGASEAS